MEEPSIFDQEIWVQAQALPLFSLHSCGVFTCKIGIGGPLLRSKASPYEGRVRSWALKDVVTGQPRAQMSSGCRIAEFIPAFHKSVLRDVVQPLDFGLLSLVICKMRALVLDLLTSQVLWCLKEGSAKKMLSLCNGEMQKNGEGCYFVCVVLWAALFL